MKTRKDIERINYILRYTYAGKEKGDTEGEETGHPNQGKSAASFTAGPPFQRGWILELDHIPHEIGRGGGGEGVLFFCEEIRG